MFKKIVIAVALATGLASTALLGADEAAPGARADTFVAGGSLRIDKPVPGDLVAAGGNVDVDAPVGGDAVLVGGNLRVTAKVEHNVYAGGGRVILDAPIGHNLRVGGGQVDLGPMAEVTGNVSVGGGQVTLRGPVKGSLHVAGGRVLIDGPVAGDVVSTAGHLALGPNARLAGGLRYRSKEDLERDPAAQVAGAVERLALPGRGERREPERGWGREGVERTLGTGLFWTVGLMVIAAVLVVALPVSSRRVADAMRSWPGWSLLWGFVALVCIPAAALVLLITVIGIPLALLTLLLYGVLLLLGYVASGLALGQWALSRFRPAAAALTGWRVAAAMLAMAALALLGRVPVVGGFVGFVAVLAGIGAIALMFWPRKAAA